MKKLLIILCLIALSTGTYLFFSDRRPADNPSTSKLNRQLVDELESILSLDQKYRMQIDSLRRIYGDYSNEMQSFYRTMSQTDDANLSRVKQILDQYGWLGPDIIGLNGSAALFLVIQHSDQVTQEKYLPIMRTAVKERKARAADLALLEDRVLLGQGKKQIYGSQVGFDSKTNSYSVLPLADPDSVNSRRLSVGLGPLSEYLNYFHIKWNLLEYKKTMLINNTDRRPSSN